MKHLLETLGHAPVRRACMGDLEAINLSTCVFLHDCSEKDVLGFCYWASQVLGQGMHFVAGTYASQGVAPRSEWAFWAPVRSPSGENHESVFTTRLEKDGRWHYSLFFYGNDEPLHRTLEACVLHASVGEGDDFTSILGHPEREEDDGVTVTRFEVAVPGSVLHYVSLLTKAQFR